jgi:pimeloyl-ACP methyl ester carboxylesterase
MSASAPLEIESVGQGPDLVLLHSLLAERSSFERVKPMLAKSFRLHLVHLPGYGGSKVANERTIEDFADRVAEEEIFSKKPFLLGNAFGGFIATALAIRHREKIGALIAAPAIAGFAEPAREPFRMMASKARASGMAAIAEAAIQRMFPPAFSAAHPGIVEERKRALDGVDTEGFARACLAIAQMNLRDSLNRIQARSLVLVGALDQTTPASAARELAGAIKGAQFLELPGCGHCPQIEQPESFVAAVRGFLSV